MVRGVGRDWTEAAMEISGWIMVILYHLAAQVCRRFSGRVFL
jgi:hypothetical protein